jgi:histidinol-phosphatase
MKEADPADVALTLKLCDAADAITLSAYRQANLEVAWKLDGSPVTEADRAVEGTLRGELSRQRPNDAVLGEEEGERAGSGARGSSSETRRWIIDPIDGTANYVRGLPLWATLIALEVEGRVVVGAVSAPGLGRRWWAARGLGSYAVSSLEGPTRMQVSNVGELTDAYMLGTSLSWWLQHDRLGGYTGLTSRCRWDRGIGDFWSHMLVAEGCAEVGVDPVGYIWDLAALQVIVEEAGGTFTDLNGRSWLDGGSGVSSNGLLHAQALAILAGTAG